jgi:hypothetical protein
MDLTTAIQIVGLVAILIAGLQFWEVRLRRRFDTYWQFFTVYSSEEYRRAREGINEIRGAFGPDLQGQESRIAELAETYVAKFHSSRRADRPDDDEPRVRKADERARLRVRFFNTAGAVIHKRLVDKKLLLELIGPAFDRDYVVIRAFVEGNREAHKLRVYGDVERLKKQYDRWAKRRRLRDRADARDGDDRSEVV